MSDAGRDTDGMKALVAAVHLTTNRFEFVSSKEVRALCDAITTLLAKVEEQAQRIAALELRETLAGFDPTCDWGNCNEPTVALREDGDQGDLLPVCKLHSSDLCAPRAGSEVK